MSMRAPLPSLLSLLPCRGPAIAALRSARVVASAADANKRGPGLRPHRLQQPRRIARHLIDFEIEASARCGEHSEGGDLQRVRDDQHRKSVALDLVDGERYAVERDRTLGRDEARQ